MRPRAWPIAAASVIALVSGCYASVDEPPVAYAETEVTPVDVAVAPQTVYEGHIVYYSGDRWWYQDGHRWAYYRSEPEPLYRHRTYVQAAPPAPRYYRQEAPPQTLTGGQVAAPPAVRVR